MRTSLPPDAAASASACAAGPDRDCLESAYCFFHQKWQVYRRSTLDWQRDDIEYAIAQYADAMDRPLYQLLAAGRPGFLLSHAAFSHDLSEAVERLEELMPTAGEQMGIR